MAKRPIFIPSLDPGILVRTVFVEFTWHAGMAASQRKKSVISLHAASKEQRLCNSPLEVSTKSDNELGFQLSAFNLTVTTKNHERAFTVETAFQSSKVFQYGGPYEDLLYGKSIAAKRDSRIKNSGDLLKFKFFGTEWELEPKTAFYDWIFLNALKKNPWAIEQLDDFDAFTDIEFNPKKSINCQAYSVALFQSLKHRKLLDEALANKESFLRILSNYHHSDTYRNSGSQQPELF